MVLDLLAKYGVPLIEGDIYGDIYFGKEQPKPAPPINSVRRINPRILKYYQQPQVMYVTISCECSLVGGWNKEKAQQV